MQFNQQMIQFPRFSDLFVVDVLHSDITSFCCYLASNRKEETALHSPITLFSGSGCSETTSIAISVIALQISSSHKRVVYRSCSNTSAAAL